VHIIDERTQRRAGLLPEIPAERDEWETPVPLLEMVELPTFPAQVLPDPFDAYVVELARATQTPVDLPGVMVLGALAAAAGGRAIVEARPGWREPTNLFLAVALPPGNRKSAVAQQVTQSLYEAETSEIARTRDAITDAKVAQDIARDRARKAQREAADADDDNRANLEHTARAAAALADSITVPVMPRLLADDATPEALTTLLAEQHGRIAVISAEAGPFDMMSGRYSKFPPLEVYLKGHAGDHLRVDRKGRPSEIIERPALTIALCFQPAVLATLAQREGFRARGLLARFLYSVPHSFVGHRTVGVAPIDPWLDQQYHDLMRALVLSLTQWEDPQILVFSAEANEVLLHLERRLEPDLAPIGDLGPIADWGAKLAGAVVRIAGLLHLARNLKTGYREAITADTVEAAVTLGDYFRAHAVAAHGLMGGSAAEGDARALLHWIARRSESSFSRRDAQQAHRSRFPKATDIDPALALLEGNGWIRRRPDPAPGPEGGRPKSPTYDVHPDAQNAA
jgi:hypothetical protein